MLLLRRKIFIALTVVWMIVIFLFSSKNADASAADSSFVGECIGHIFYEGYDNLDEVGKLEFIDKVDYPIRKTAHFLEYMILGVLLLGCVDYNYNDNGNARKKILLSWLVGTVYAASDEIHQLFVQGRSCQITDVLLDSLGVFVGVMLMKSVLKIIVLKNLEDLV